MRYPSVYLSTIIQSVHISRIGVQPSEGLIRDDVQNETNPLADRGD